MTSEWRPLLSGTERKSAIEATRAVADSLCEVIDGTSAGRAIPIAYRNNDEDLVSREAGVAVCLAYMAGSLESSRYRQAAEQAMALAEARVASTPRPPTLFSGFVGVAWALDTVAREIGAPETIDVDTFREVDDVLLQYVARGTTAIPYELANGLVGLGVYALRRLPNRSALACAEAVIRGLAAKADVTEIGLAWPAEDPATREADPSSPTYHLGVAHGLAGAIAFLSGAYTNGVLVPKTRALLEGAVAFLLAHRQRNGRGAFARSVKRGNPNGSVDLSWCWGDPGISLALLQASRATSNSAWEDIAIEVAHSLAVRAKEEAWNWFSDCSLCHGIAGLGHILNRFYHATGDGQLGEAARYWFRVTLKARQSRAVGGFRFQIKRDAAGRTRWRESASLLVGSAGVGAALAAACSEQTPLWDHALLMATPTGVPFRTHALDSAKSSERTVNGSAADMRQT